MPVIPSMFGGSCRDDLISFSSLNTRDAALDGLFPTPRRGPAREMRMRPFHGTRIRSDETAEHHVYKADLKALLRVEDAQQKVEEAGILQVCGERRSPKGKEQRSPGGETSLSKFRHRILVPDDAEVEQARAAIRKGVLMITMPRKGMENRIKILQMGRPGQL